MLFNIALSSLTVIVGLLLRAFIEARIDIIPGYLIMKRLCAGRFANFRNIIKISIAFLCKFLVISYLKYGMLIVIML
jgi:hypothetical protein